jgi:hypothetical protein
MLLLALLWLLPAVARGQDATGARSSDVRDAREAHEGEPGWCWPLEMPTGPAALRLGLVPPVEAGEPLTAVAIEALARWRALRAVVDVSASHAVAVEATTTIVGHASFAWGDAVVRPMIDVELSWSAAAIEPPGLRAGPAIVADARGGHSLVAAATYASDGRELRVDLVYELIVDAGM